MSIFINRKYYLLVLYVFFVQFWGLKMFAVIPPDMELAMTLGLLIVGPVYYHMASRRPSLLNASNAAPITWIVIALVISMEMAKMYYGQSFMVSLTSYKAQYLMLGGLSLLIIAPTKDEIIGSLKLYAILFTLVYMVHIVSPGMFVMGEKNAISNVDESSILGYEILPILLYYYFDGYVVRPSLKNVGKIFWILALLFMMQNRSSLIPVILCSVYLFWNVKSRYRGVIIMALSVIIGIFVITTISTWNELIQQSISELTNPRYNRIIALNYFLLQGSDTLLTILFGNGFISNHTSSLMGDLMAMGIYNSDMGFLGYWNQFGLIPIIVFLYMIIKTMRGRSYPGFVKYYAFQILMCAPTIMYFGQQPKIICFLLFFYLFEIYRPKRHVAPVVAHSLKSAPVVVPTAYKK